MTAFYWTLSILLVVALVAIGVQHHRYLRARRDVVVDRQEIFHSSSVFHVITVLELAPDQELLSAVRTFVGANEGVGGRVVYAGKIAVNAMQSSQIPQAEWDAFVLVQFPSREAYGAFEADPETRKLRSTFATTYALGMKRPPWLNLAVPAGLLGKRLVDRIQGHPARLPFRPAASDAGIAHENEVRRADVIEGLLANRGYGDAACVVLNFIKNGSPEERAADSGYALEMLGLMAEGGFGPMHMGKAVTLEGDADFDHVAIVYYPGVSFFAEMVQSEFFTGIVGGKQLGDTLSSPSVPLLPHL